MDLYYEMTGEGTPLVLLHSGGADLRDWTWVAPVLAQQYKVIALDGRGCGQSPNPAEEPPDYVDDLLRALDHLGLPQAVIAGHSMGGQIAAEFALKYPERVTKLVLIAPGLAGFAHSPEFLGWMRRIREAAPDVDRMMEIALSGPSYRIVMAGPRREMMERMWKENTIKMMQWGTWESVWPQPPAAERLGELAVPALFILGREDVPDLHRIAECFRAVPDIRFAWLEGADHKPTLTHPEEICRLIIEFVEGRN
ncbi:alpha/beta fold hydrolase [Paenibacillus mucilaginosus]|uniref:Putative hydrolase n=1 Tax=Paenibacillus mucilaginosus (strain KNP414) TaxID=1036673 RepID=F8FBU1_PAEMK|nr:alpha/beta hydrolase [Paenibacillus mucilaginosus]AEI43142.1 putative hydrolase [Paenibacillus mucilaginosus KNP414]MCG7212291.1 alpha/beta hydrolase [Paenibacillus mucilaginosus]WDM24748.1 alpha/beta hydrolase [Paenibacillus mucilaginosus]